MAHQGFSQNILSEYSVKVTISRLSDLYLNDVCRVEVSIAGMRKSGRRGVIFDR